MSVNSVIRRFFSKEEPSNTEELHYVKSRPGANPDRGTKLSAGFDVYVPDDFPVTVLQPRESVMIPTGIHTSFDPRFVLISFNKSGVAAKKKLLVGAQVVDADYQGEIHVNLHNVGTEPVEISPGDKVTQFILLPVSIPELVECSSLGELYPEGKSERGTGMMGSTGERRK